MNSSTEIKKYTRIGNYRIPRVLMFGPHLNATSGISNVVNNWLEAGIKEKVDLQYIATLKKYVPGRYLEKFLEAIVAYILLISKTQKEIDIIHLHMSSHMSFFRKWAILKWAKFKKIKTIIHLHGSVFEEFFNKSNPTIKQMIINIFDSADAVFVLSNSWEKFVHSISKNKNIYIVYNGAGLNKFSGKIYNKDRIIISFMGRLGERKGIYDLLDAFEKIIAEIPNAQLVLGGDGDVEKVRELVARKNLEDHIHVLGWVSGAQKLKVFKECDIYVLPSYNEGLPGSILEAMASGVPIISTHVGGISEAVIENRNGFLINPGDIATLYDKLKILCQNKNLREKMGKESKNIIIEKFDIEKIVFNLVNIYQKVAFI